MRVTGAWVAAFAWVVGCTEPAYTTPELGEAKGALGPDATVADAIDSECSTASIRGLGQQLIDEVQCTQPGTFDRIDDLDNVVLGAATFPWLQTAAAEALHVVASKRPDDVMTINSAYRTVAQQLMLYSWYRDGQRCGIALAAKPGNSNHESALAVDVDENAAWRSTFQANDFTWLGGSDPVHFDYSGDALTADLRELSVEAFQRLWNRNHPEDPIDEDGEYGGATESRILRSPAAGFAVGASCIEASTPDAGSQEPRDAGSATDAGRDAGPSGFVADPAEVSEPGCSAAADGTRGTRPLAVLVVAMTALLRRRRSGCRADTTRRDAATPR